MARLREFLQKNPAAGYGIAVLLIALAGYLLVTRILGATTAQAPAPPAPAQQPAAPPAATPAPPAPPAPVAPPATVSAKVVPPGPSGRGDPFVPLVKPPASASPQPPRPSAPLPPPPFPVPGTPLPAPPLPGPPQPAPAPPLPSAGIAVTGIVSDATAVVVVQIGSRTEILFEGESAGDLKVVKIDAARRIVTFERAGKRFDVAMGGV